MTRFSPSRNYWTAGLVAIVLAAVSAWFALRWPPSLIASVLFLLSAVLLFLLALRPPIEIYPQHLRMGDRVISWSDIRRVDRTGWVSPLVLHLGLSDDSIVRLIFPGDLESANSLLRHVQRSAHHALIDGVPYREFWADAVKPALPPAAAQKQLASPKYKLLLDEDEAEVERLYQRLKAVGHLDSKEES
jgi:hypothetical protein